MEKEKNEKVLPYLICPVCARNICLYRHRGERPHYNLWDKETSPIIYIRNCPGGKKLEGEPSYHPKPGWRPGTGFHIVERISWDEALKKEEYRSILEEIKEQIKKLARQILTKEEREEFAKKE